MADPRVHDIHFGSADEIQAALDSQVSKGGWFIVCDDPDPRGSSVLLRFHLPGLAAPFEVPGEVAFAAPKTAPVPGLGSGMAIQFQKLSTQLVTAFSAAVTIARTEAASPPPPAAAPPVQELEPATADSAPAESDEWTEEPGENWPDGPADGPAQEPDEAQQRKILATINTQNTENLYGTLRQMPFHQKVVAAKRGNRAVRAILIQEGNQKVLNFILQNPQLSVPEIITILKLPTVTYDLIQTIAKNAAWAQSEEVRFLIILHPKTPLPLALNIMPNLNVNSIAKLAKSGGVKAQLKSTAIKLLEQRRKSG